MQNRLLTIKSNKNEKNINIESTPKSQKKENATKTQSH